jgi:hypothetical protein
VPETCPAMTTCPTVCVSTVEECPTTCSGNTTLCANGACQEECDVNDSSPCACPSSPVACPKVVDYYEECFSSFQAFYDQDATCQQEQQASIPETSFTGPYFIVCVGWICTVTAMVVGWCYFNEKLCPFREATSATFRINPISAQKDGSDRFLCTQTGYKRTVVGTIVYIFVLLTLVGIQLLLFVLVMLFYVQTGAITRWSPAFASVEEVNKLFILVWMVGFPWTMAFCFIPTGVYTLFLRRCPIGSASFVAISSPSAQAKDNDQINNIYKMTKRWLSLPTGLLRRYVFSYPHVQPGHDVSFCAVQVDSLSGDRGLYYRLRRYVWNKQAGRYKQGKISVGESLQDFLNQRQGLQSEEVVTRTGIVGPNMPPVAKPTILAALRKEFGRPFYKYQSFVYWSWMPNYYFHLGLAMTSVRVAGGCLSAYYQLLSDLALYRVSHFDGQAT